CREQHCERAHDVDERDHAVARVVHEPEHTERSDRPDEDQPIDDEVDERERALELLPIAESLDARSVIRAHSLLVATPPERRGLGWSLTSRTPNHNQKSTTVRSSGLHG